MKLSLVGRGICCLLLTLATPWIHADSTWVYAVQISAVVQITPPAITLNWEPDQYGANSYKVYRKAKDATAWGAATDLSGTTSNFTDFNVAVGSTYEYKIVKAATLGYTGYGYIFTGINAALTEARGTLLLIVATNSTAGLDFELARLQSDLIGDGWQVLRHDVSSNDSPASVRGLIATDYHADPANVNSVFLFGHVPILQSGNLNYDGHQARPMPADAYYGDVDGNWSASPGYLPSDVELMVGRVDLADMPGVGAPIPWGSEVELLRTYLDKDHNWRHNLVSVPRRALMGNRRGDESGVATASSGYRNFETFVGPGNTIEADIDDNAPPQQRWISMLGADSYLWAYGCGGGQRAAISALGTNGQYSDVWSTDIVSQDARAVFVMLFGSWFGNWDGQDNIMRSVLVTPGIGLASCMSGCPHWFLHHMGLGETIGYGTRLTMNNSKLYQCESNLFPRAVYIALMGDPSLRMEPVTPPAALSATAIVGGTFLNWTASPDAVVGYHVYRAATAAGPFTRLNSALLTDTNFTDYTSSLNSYTYMVRAVKLQTNPSGSYYNPSQGLLAATGMTLVANRNGGGIVLNWNSQIGVAYHVQARASLSDPWANQSGTLTASSANSTWTDNNAGPEHFYRITSP